MAPLTVEQRLDRLERIVVLLADGHAPPVDPAFVGAYRALVAEIEALRGYDEAATALDT